MLRLTKMSWRDSLSMRRPEPCSQTGCWAMGRSQWRWVGIRSQISTCTFSSLETDMFITQLKQAIMDIWILMTQTDTVLSTTTQTAPCKTETIRSNSISTVAQPLRPPLWLFQLAQSTTWSPYRCILLLAPVGMPVLLTTSALCAWPGVKHTMRASSQ